MYFSSVYPQILLPGLYRLTDVSCARPLTKPGEKIQMSLKSEVHQNYPLLKSFHSLLCREDKAHFLYIVYVLCPMLEMHLLWSNSKNANVFKVNMMEG